MFPHVGNQRSNRFHCRLELRGRPSQFANPMPQFGRRIDVNSGAVDRAKHETDDLLHRLRAAREALEDAERELQRSHRDDRGPATDRSAAPP